MGDLHDKAARLGEIQGLEEADGIIVTGDLTVTGGAAQARNVLEKLTRYNPVIYAQIGNMDRRSHGLACQAGMEYPFMRT